MSHETSLMVRFLIEILYKTIQTKLHLADSTSLGDQSDYDNNALNRPSGGPISFSETRDRLCTAR